MEHVVHMIAASDISGSDGTCNHGGERDQSSRLIVEPEHDSN